LDDLELTMIELVLRELSDESLVSIDAENELIVCIELTADLDECAVPASADPDSPSPLAPQAERMSKLTRALTKNRGLGIFK